jgi:hypothetical protein
LFVRSPWITRTPVGVRTFIILPRNPMAGRSDDDQRACGPTDENAPVADLDASSWVDFERAEQRVSD